MTVFLTLVVSGLMVGSIYSLVAIGFSLIYKSSGVFNFAQGEMLLLGGYVFWTLVGPMNLPAWAALFISLAVAVIFGLAVERFALRSLIGESMLCLIMATLALQQILWGGIIMAWGARQLSFVEVIPHQGINVGLVTLSIHHLYAAGIACGLLVLLTLFFRYTRVGLAMRGMAEGHIIVQSMGISPKTMISISWAIAAIIATIGGSLFGMISGFSLSLSAIGLKAIPAAFIGGLDSIEGVVIGGLLIGVLEMVVSGYVGMAAGTPAVFLALVVVMAFRPTGFFGLKRIERV